MASTRITAGNTEIISLTDLEMQFPWPAFFPSVPMNELEKYHDLYPESWGDFGFKTDAGCYAIRSEGETIVASANFLIDAESRLGAVGAAGAHAGHGTAVHRAGAAGFAERARGCEWRRGRSSGPRTPCV